MTATLPNTRRDALELGVERYYTGKPCKLGHVAERSTRNGECIECATIRWQAEQREHPERAAARTAAWRSRNPDYSKNYIKQWRAANPEKAKALLQKWRSENPLRVREHAARVNCKNPQKNRDRMMAWVKAHPDLHRAHGRNRRARAAKAEGHHTAADIAAILAAQKRRCAYCGVGIARGFCVDHIRPLARGGSNWPSNLQLTCKPCNSRKHAKDPVRFAQELGLLL